MSSESDISSFLGDDEVIVVVTDYNRYSVALSYDFDSDDAPRVVKKGENMSSKHINEEAEKKGIENFDSPFLACMLYVTTEVGQEIIEDHYWPVAEIIAFVGSTKYAQNRRFRKPKPDKYIFRSMGLNIKTAVQQ